MSHPTLLEEKGDQGFCAVNYVTRLKSGYTREPGGSGDGSVWV